MKSHRLQALLSAISLVFSLLCSANLAVSAQAPVPDSPAIEAQAHAMIAKLTLADKIELLGGVDNMFTRPMPSIDLPRFKMSDASVGVRTWGPTTAYAGGAALAATWDTDFARKLGQSLGLDARARNVNFLLGPGVNIARSPISGRNFEYLSEDPFLNASLVVPFIEGVQSEGVAATVKHYALNDQEFNRHNASADIDERTMREIYLPAFEAAVTKAHVDAVMNSYNLVNGVHSTQNNFLNLKVLKGEWGFQGVLMSDWDATYDGVAAVNNGLDLEMPSPKFMNAKNLTPAVQSGQVNEATIDEHLQRLFRTELRYGWTDHPQFDPTDSTYSVADRAVALQGALESITLLKNEGNLLPLDPAKIKSVAVIGPDAYPAVTGGGGSSEAHAFEPVSILTGIANLLGPNVHVFYSAGIPDGPGQKELVTHADAVILSVGFSAATEREGADRTFTLPTGQDALIQWVAAVNPRTIVTLTGGGGMDTSRWLDKVPVLLHTFYPGQEGGTAVAQILFGQHDPEGKLPVSFDRSWDENPSTRWYYGDPKDNTTLHTTGVDGQPKDYTVEHIQYGDKLMVGYRYWTTTGKHPLFPFGFGLSYTTFKFSNLGLPAKAKSGSQVDVSFDVTNTGNAAGAEVAQLYVSDPSAQTDRPERELKGFQKIRLDPGQTKHVTISLDARSFSYWDQSAQRWIIDPGKFVIRVGDSSENTPLTAEIDLH
ncbi:MAG TPA: glycoside hydrolase family 3 C-terminal domain-containing protein [Terracidiphilus sp.]|jgi:beta-glucosidase